MNTLWTFGDSFTQSYIPPIDRGRNWRNDYIEWKGYHTKVYPEFIAEKLNLNLINKGVGGCDNSYIFEEFCKVASQIQKNDIVIFGWTDVHRFRFFNDKNECGFFNVNVLDKDAGPIFSQEFFNTLDCLSVRTVEEILINRDSKMFLHELCNWINLINLFLKDINVIHWSWDRNNSICKNIIISTRYERIFDETKGSIIDYHWSENGQKMFSEHLIKKINKDNLI
jgi:hypothetical protein